MSEEKQLTPDGACDKFIYRWDDDLCHNCGVAHAPWNLDALIADRDRLREALDRLCGEVGACWGMCEPLFRREFGNTNYNIIQERLDEARKALAQSEGG